MSYPSIVGVLFMVFGIVSFFNHAFTIYSQNRIVDAGFFDLTFKNPSAFLTNPLIGPVCVILGTFMFLISY